MSLLFIALIAVTPSKSADKAAAPAVAMTAAHEKAVRHLLEVTHAGEMGKQVLQQMAASMQQAVPDAPAGFWSDFLKSAKPEELTNLLVGIYGKYLTQKDCEDLTTFYEGPLGKKLLNAQPAIMQESMAAGQAWGQKLAQDVMQRLQDQKAKAAPAADGAKKDGTK